MDATPDRHADDADVLLRAALIDAAQSAAVSLKVGGLPVSQTVTVVFHGRRDLGTIQTYIAPGALGQGDTVGADRLLRVPCDLDLADADDREEAERLYRSQAHALRDALEAADTVLALWREELGELAGPVIDVDRRVGLGVPLPAPRLMPTALVAPERGLVVAPVCGARTLADGRPPLGIACAQPDVSRIYPLPEDPEQALADFFTRSGDHARRLADRLAHQEASVERFLELSGEDEDKDRDADPPA
jgi:hypothetical protein